MTAGLSLRLPKDLPDGLFPKIILSKNLQIHKVCLDKLWEEEHDLEAQQLEPREPGIILVPKLGLGTHLENGKMGTVAHEPLAPSKSMKRGTLLLVRSAHPTRAGTEARPTNLKLET